MSSNFCSSISIFGDVCAELLKNCFLEVSQFEPQIGICEYFSWKFHELSDFFELSSFFVAHSDEKLGGVGGITAPPHSHLVVKGVIFNLCQYVFLPVPQ